MAKTSVVMRQKKRERIVSKYEDRRNALKKIIQDPSASVEARWQAQQKIQRLPRDSSKVRLRNRCMETGRPRGVYRLFGLSRMVLRERAMRGELPGILTSSW